MPNYGNEQQYQDILQSASAKICVIAGPGSGKTTEVLLPKAKQVVADEGVDIDEVLLLTFSRLTALELKNKVKALDRVPHASTLHSLCLSFLLSEDNHDIRSRIDSIMLDFEKEILISDLKLKFTDKSKRQLKKTLDEFGAGWAVKQHDEVFNENDEHRLFKLEVLNWLSEHEAALMEEIVYFAVDLAKKLKDGGVIPDFIDKPKYIFVDEFQDLNKLEQEFVEILAENSQLLVVVGDPDQSIYSFKFAHPEGIIDFSNRSDVECKRLTFSGRCGRKIINVANQLLTQADPQRTQLLNSLPNAEEGEVQLLTKYTQQEEFDEVLSSIAAKLNSGINEKDIFILVPRRKLGIEFARYANTEKQNKNIDSSIIFHFTIKSELTEKEKEKILEFSLIANSSSVLHLRSCLGLGDNNHFAKEIEQLKRRYGTIKNAFSDAKAEDFDRRKRRIRMLCERINNLKELIESFQSEESVTNIIDRLLPENDPDIVELRRIFLELKEEGDTVKILYDKFIDYTRTIHYRDNVVRIITLMSSKGLEADHIYVLGCNDGNIPGQNRSAYLNNHDFKNEQRRLLYVACTRAKKSLTVSWSRNIPFAQSRGHYTGSVGTITINGGRYSQVGISEFLQDLDIS